jgi:hypothetical protein
MTYHIKTPEQQSFAQNLAAIAAEFHTHRLYNDFYDTFGKYIAGFIGNYDLCIRMAEALTDWEIFNGGLLAYDNADVTWIEVIENFTDDMLQRSIETGGILNALTVLRQIQILQPASPT